MDSARIAELLRPFASREQQLPANLLAQLQLYLDLLLKWNARVNLTAIRDPEQIVTRHFGESLFAARVWTTDFPPRREAGETLAPILTVADIGSGAGFPGIPIKLWAPDIALTLIESQNKKATFLREVIRTLKLDDAQVFAGRAEEWGRSADVVTLRAVEQFERTLPVAAGLVRQGGQLVLLIGARRVDRARDLLGAGWTYREPVPVPLSTARVVLLADRPAA